MADVAVITALFNLIVANIRDKGNGLPTKPAEVRETLEAIVAALSISDDAKETLYGLIAAMLPDNMIKAIDPYELRDVLNAIVAAIPTSGGTSGSVAVYRVYTVGNPTGDEVVNQTVSGNLSLSNYPDGASVNDLQSFITDGTVFDVVQGGGQPLTNTGNKWDALYQNTSFWVWVKITNPSMLTEFSDEFLITEFL